MSLRSSHFARSSEIYEEPLSDSSLGRWRTLALSSPAASSAISSVAVTSSAFIVGHSFQATMERGKSSRTLPGENHPQPLTFEEVKGVGQSLFAARVFS